MQTLIVTLIVAAAAMFVGRQAWSAFSKSRADSAGGCANCDASSHSADDWAK